MTLTQFIRYDTSIFIQESPQNVINWWNTVRSYTTYRKDSMESICFTTWHWIWMRTWTKSVSMLWSFRKPLCHICWRAGEQQSGDRVIRLKTFWSSRFVHFSENLFVIPLVSSTGCTGSICQKQKQMSSEKWSSVNWGSPR